jgi:uncharacterized protein (DUF427 family)
MMAKAEWRGAVLAESDGTIVVEGSHYFPRDRVHSEYFVDSKLTTACPWKGTASYRTVVVDGKKNKNASWFYPDPKDAAAEIKDHVAFWKGVKVTT